MNFFLSFKNLLLSSTCILLSVSLSGCQKPASEISKEQHAEQKVEVIVPDLNQICENLKKEMREMTAQRTTFALEQINQNIRVCLPLISHAEQKKLMDLSNQMYAQFLQIDRTPEQQKAFDEYALDESQYPTIQQSHFEKLHIRDQYLLRHKGQAYIELSDLNIHNISYKRNSQYLAKVFAPYFPEDEKEFMQNLADQNEVPFFNRNTLLISPEEIAQRALFWERYLKKFPKSRFKSDAQYIYDTYRTLLFIGLKNSPVSTNYEDRLDVQPLTLSTIEQLSIQKDSALAVQAGQFLTFIEMPPEQRMKLSHAQESDNAQAQLMKMLNLKSVDLSQKQKRHCFEDAICY